MDNPYAVPEANLDPKSQEALAALAAELPTSIPIDVNTMFPVLTGRLIKSGNKRRAGYAREAAPLLERMLEDGEQVQYVASGVVNFIWEMLLMGVWAQMINRALIIVTTRRLLLVHCDIKGRPESFINEVPRSAIVAVKPGFLGSLEIKTVEQNRSLSGLGKGDKTGVANLFEPVEQPAGGLRMLCPRCFAPHPKHALSCVSCGLTAKSPKSAMIRSLVLPGLGDWYLGHRLPAVFEMLGSFITWVVSLVLIAGGGLTTVAGIALLIFVNGGDALLTHLQAKKGMMSPDGSLPMMAGAGPITVGERSAVVPDNEPPPPII